MHILYVRIHETISTHLWLCDTVYMQFKGLLVYYMLLSKPVDLLMYNIRSRHLLILLLLFLKVKVRSVFLQ